MDKKIIDEMKKESKIPRNIMIFCCILIVSTLGYMYLNNKNILDKDILIIFLICFICGVLGLYEWLYAVKYRVEFNNEKLLLKTCFKKIELNIHDIEKYTCIRYRKSVFYQFKLYIKDKKVLVNTRYKDELKKILRDNKIEEIK